MDFHHLFQYLLEYIMRGIYRELEEAVNNLFNVERIGDKYI